MLIFQKKRLINNTKGFLLIEAITSVLVISVSLVFIIRSFSSSLKVVNASKGYFEASLLLEEVMWPFNEAGISEGESNGEFVDNENFNWTAKSSLFNQESGSTKQICKVVALVSSKNNLNKTGGLGVVTLLNKKKIP